MTKTCTLCKHKKDIELFSFRLDTKDGRKPRCKQCTNEKNMDYKERNNERSRNHYLKNKPRYSELGKIKWEKYKKENAEVIAQKRKEYDAKLAERRKTRIDRRNKQRAINRKRRMISDSIFATSTRIRNRIAMAIKQQCTRKAEKTAALLGCGVADAMSHIESKFREGMTWQNHGRIWHLDHIVPLRAFDLSTIEGQKRAFNFKNLQPLFVLENLTKNDKLSCGTSARTLARKS